MKLKHIKIGDVMEFIASKDPQYYHKNNGSMYVFTDDMKYCQYCGRKFMTNNELLFHLEGCQKRQCVLYPKKRKPEATQTEIYKWLI